jgi:drug/metabolite transporter (DMT)-like permease
MTAILLATQEPFSALAARKLSGSQFVWLTQAALLLSVPLLILPAASRHDFFALLLDFNNARKFAALLAIGLGGVVLYNLGLSNAHPIIVAAVLNLSPFWAAMVALLVSKKPIPVSSTVFFGSLAAAFVGAMIIVWSQVGPSSQPSFGELASRLAESTWIYAIPIPILFALSGTLVGKWFAKCDESAVIAANFVISAAILIPACLVLSYFRAEPLITESKAPAVLLLLFGTLASAAAGRVLYQISLSLTKNDNGFVTMFFMLVPGLTSLISVPLSWWIPDLKFMAGPMFFFGLALVAAALILFSFKAWR